MPIYGSLKTVQSAIKRTQSTQNVSMSSQQNFNTAVLHGHRKANNHKITVRMFYKYTTLFTEVSTLDSNFL